MNNQCNCDYLAPSLKGLTFTGQVLIDQSDDEGWQKLVLVDEKGKKFQIEPSCDPEGNSPGFLFFGPVE